MPVSPSQTELNNSADIRDSLHEMDASIQAMNVLLCEDNMNIIDQHISQLKTRRNALLPVARLPTEIIARVFFLLARPLWEEKTWDWLELTKVCKSWRYIALGCASLWAEITPSFQKLKVEAFLTRSMDADLTVEMSKHEGSIYSYVLDLIRHHMKRVRELEISTGGEIAEWDDIQTLFKDPMPRLRNLHLRAIDLSANEDHNNPTILLNQLALSSPVVPLREISLHGVMLPWGHSIFRGLSTISLVNIKEVHLRPTINELLAIFSASPNLRELVLHNIGPRLSSEDYTRVALPKLRLLDVSKIDYSAFVVLFNLIILPKDVGWTIEDVLNPFTESRSFPNNLLNRSDTCNELDLCLNDHSLSITAHFDTRDEGRSDSFDDLDMYLTLNDEHISTLPHGMLSFFQSLEAFFKHSFFANVTNLTLELGFMENRVKMASLTATAWGHLFVALRKIDTLDVSFLGDEDDDLQKQFIAALTVSKNDTTGVSDVVFANLGTIVLSSANFSTRQGRQTYKMLLSNLDFRRQNGKRLNKLEFANCDGIGAKELQKMRSMNIANTIRT